MFEMLSLCERQVQSDKGSVLQNNEDNDMKAMGTKFNFNSQVCTSREQSEKLLKLGLKKETADMIWTHAYYSTWAATARENPLYFHEADEDTVPAWSLSRLLCMLSSVIPLGEEFPSFGDYAFLRLYTMAVSYEYEDYDGDERIVVGFNGNGFFAAVVDAIEWLIKEGYFNKEYLV